MGQGVSQLLRKETGSIYNQIERKVIKILNKINR